MSKFYGQLRYKDWCIIKHKLENSIEDKEEWYKNTTDGYFETREDVKPIYDKARKEINEEKAVLKNVIKIVDKIQLLIKKEGR